MFDTRPALFVLALTFAPPVSAFPVSITFDVVASRDSPTTFIDPSFTRFTPIGQPVYQPDGTPVMVGFSSQRLGPDQAPVFVNKRSVMAATPSGLRELVGTGTPIANLPGSAIATINSFSLNATNDTVAFVGNRANAVPEGEPPSSSPAGEETLFVAKEGVATRILSLGDASPSNPAETISRFGQPFATLDGRVIFSVETEDSTGGGSIEVYEFDGTGLNLLAPTGEFAPIDIDIDVAPNGDVLLPASLGLGSPRALVAITASGANTFVQGGDTFGNPAQRIGNVFEPAISGNGEVAFTGSSAFLNDPTNFSRRLFTGTLGGIDQSLDLSGQVPGGDADDVFGFLLDLVIGPNGDKAFTALIRDGTDPSSDSRLGLFSAIGGEIVPIAIEGAEFSIDGQTGILTDLGFGEGAVNANGDILFSIRLQDRPNTITSQDVFLGAVQASVAPTVIPLPAGGWMLISALGIILGARALRREP